MLIYYLFFFITFIVSCIAQKKINNKKIFVLLSIICIIIPSILAGLRQSGIGTDTRYYIDFIFNKVSEVQNIKQLFFVITTYSIEFGYIIFNFIISRFTDNLNIMYFFLQLVIMSISYYSFVKYSKQNFNIIYLIFNLLYFNRTLNICRQSIAIAFILMSYKYINQKKLYKFIIIVLIASFFHKTALVFLPAYFILNFIKEKNCDFRKICIITSLLLILVFFKNIIPIFITSFNIGEKYYKYLSGENINISTFIILVKFIQICIFLAFYKQLVKVNANNKDFIFLTILDLIMYLFGFYGFYLQRMSFYFEIFNVFVISDLVTCVKTKNEQLIITFAIILLSIMYSYYIYGILGWGETAPYLSILK